MREGVGGGRRSLTRPRLAAVFAPSLSPSPVFTQAQDSLQPAIQFQAVRIEQVMARYTQRCYLTLVKERVPPLILVDTLEVGRTVNFDTKTRLWAIEVENVGSNGDLSAKSKPQLLASNAAPQHLFASRHAASELPCSPLRLWLVVSGIAFHESLITSLNQIRLAHLPSPALPSSRKTRDKGRESWFVAYSVSRRSPSPAVTYQRLRCPSQPAVVSLV